MNDQLVDNSDFSYAGSYSLPADISWADRSG